MKYVPGPEMGMLSRSQGNTTASHNRNGAYLRNRIIPVNPGSVNQLLRRALMSGLSAAWRSLTAAQRAGWTALGAQVSRLDSLGQSYTLTGAQTYVMVNFYRQLNSAAIIADAPAFDSAPTLSSSTLTVSVIGPSVSVAFAPTPLPAGTRVIAYATGNRSPGQTFFGHPGVPAQSPGAYKLAKISAAAQASPLSITTEWQALFGVPIANDKVSVQLLPLSANYLPGAPVRADAIVA